MKTRTDTIEVTDTTLLPTTGRECYICEDGEFVKDGHELICNTCQHSPTFESRVETRTAWEAHDEQISDRREDGERPRLVGGYADAYWGDGEYCFSPTDGFQF